MNEWMNDAFIQRIIMYSGFKVLFITYSIIQNIISSDIQKMLYTQSASQTCVCVCGGGGGISPQPPTVEWKMIILNDAWWES